MPRLLFDIDGTLLVTRGSGAGALTKTLAETFGIATPNVDIAFGGRTDRGITEELLRINNLPVDDAHCDRLMTEYTQRLPESLRTVGGRVLPGVHTLLRRLQTMQDQFRIDVLTGNLARTARLKLEHFGLLDYFSEIHGGDHDACRNAMARRAILHPDDQNIPTVVIGDTVADIHCGRAIGARVLAVSTGSANHQTLQAEVHRQRQTEPSLGPEALVVMDDLTATDTVIEWLST